MQALNPLIAAALRPYAPPLSELAVRREIKQAQRDQLFEQRQREIDAAMQADKACDGYAQRNYRRALALQIKHLDGGLL